MGGLQVEEWPEIHKGIEGVMGWGEEGGMEREKEGCRRREEGR